MSLQSGSLLLALPPEIREQIYRIILHPRHNQVFGSDDYNSYDYTDALVLFRLNQQIYYESRKIFRDLNIFVRIQTPWPEAQDHVAIEGHVPILMKDRRAANFKEYRLNVAIEAPQMPLEPKDMQCFVVLLNDLDKFTKTWMYADLSNPGLNSHLGVRLTLHDPYTPDWEQKHVPKWLQRDLLLPFGMVKGLARVIVEGDPAPLASVKSDLRAEQLVPYKSPEACLSEATRLKAAGNAALNAGDYHKALKIYGEAWEAIHIVVRGRQRHIHAEAYFAVELTEDPWKGKNGQGERIALRIQLVANTCQVYLKLEEWDEVCYWGTRTINMMRQTVFGPVQRILSPEMEAMLDFPYASQIGKIYYRTAVAFERLADTHQARALLKVAAVYLPRDPHIKALLAALT
ncbi:hypothetical protein GQ53DRAFT_750781 [Thozetella sp. PMI_491]|nr:hypothetical protein GQ53DRAFT_750781 [Thozetella sp. PMI_491]